MSTKRRSDRVKLATIFPTSVVLKKGLDPTHDPEQLAVNQQIEKLRGRYFYLESRYQGLIATFHMLRPVLKNEALRKRLEKEGKQTASSLIATVLFEACILDCYTILIDSKETNPSLCTLCRPFLEGENRVRSANLLNRLASMYSHQEVSWPDAAIVGRLSPEVIAAWRKKTKRINE